MLWKKAAALLLAVLMLGTLAGCSREEPEPEKRIGICFRDMDDPAQKEYRENLQQAVQALGYPVTVMDAGNVQAEQDGQVRQLVEQGCSLVIVESVMVSALETVAGTLQQAGVPGIFIGNAPEADALDAWEKLHFVGCDAAQPGVLQGQIALALPQSGDLNGDGSTACLVLRGPEDSLDAQLHSEHCTQAFTYGEAPAQVLAEYAGDWTREDGKRLCAEALSRFGRDIEVIFCGNDAMALGALAAVAEGGRLAGEDIYVLGIGAEAEALEQLHLGALSGTVRWDGDELVRSIAETARKLMAGETVEQTRYVDYLKVTAEPTDG